MPQEYGNLRASISVPIIPEYFRNEGVYPRLQCLKYKNDSVKKLAKDCKKWEYDGEDVWNGYLFASKAAVQILINPISGTISDRIGYEIPMVIGLTVMFFSTM